MSPPIEVEFFWSSILLLKSWFLYPIIILPLLLEPVVLAVNLALPVTEPPSNWIAPCLVVMSNSPTLEFPI